MKHIYQSQLTSCKCAHTYTRAHAHTSTNYPPLVRISIMVSIDISHCKLRVSNRNTLIMTDILVTILWDGMLQWQLSKTGWTGWKRTLGMIAGASTLCEDLPLTMLRRWVNPSTATHAIKDPLNILPPDYWFLWLGLALVMCMSIARCCVTTVSMANLIHPCSWFIVLIFEVVPIDPSFKHTNSSHLLLIASSFAYDAALCYFGAGAVHWGNCWCWESEHGRVLERRRVLNLPKTQLAIESSTMTDASL